MGNSGFFSSIGHSRESFHSSFCSLRQYYAALPDEFELIRSELTKADEGGRCDIGMTVRLPQREGGHAWANLSGTIRIDPATGAPVLQAEFAGVDTLVAVKEEQERLYRQKLQYFHWMLDTYEGNVYVSDMDDYELLYVNQHSCDVLGMPAVKLVGRKLSLIHI